MLPILPTATLAILAGRPDAQVVQAAYRAALRALAATGRAVEINTSGWLALDASLLTWWRAEGGQAVSFGSDAHDPLSIGREFASAAAMAQAAGFGPDSDRSGLWLSGAGA